MESSAERPGGVPPFCPRCGVLMAYNGYNTYTKNGLGSVNIGRYRCPLCKEPLEEDRSFWEDLKEDFFCVMNQLYQRMRAQHISYRGISLILELIFPRGKDTIYRAFNDTVDSTIIPLVEDVRIVHYDEQHPKKGRDQNYRLTLLDGVIGKNSSGAMRETAAKLETKRHRKDVPLSVGGI